MAQSNFYAGAPRHYVAVDCIIFGFDDDGLKVLIVNRRVEPQKGAWSLMGGFVDEDENIVDAAKRVLKSLTGLKNIFLEQLGAYGSVERDPGARVISIAYYALIRTDEYNEEMGKKHGAHWLKLNEMPDLIFDHNKMIEAALQTLRTKTKTQPIGFELLPEKFTLPQLQQLYEAIHGQVLDKRNFRKKILSMNVLKKLNEKDKTHSRKGAFLYEFDKDKYNQLVKSGFSFGL